MLFLGEHNLQLQLAIEVIYKYIVV